MCGGGAAAPGAPQRVLRDLRALTPPSITPAPVVLPEYMPPATPQCALWFGLHARVHMHHMRALA